MPDYRIRRATVGDVSVLVHHRVAMFSEMGWKFDAAAVAEASAQWFARNMPSEVYRAWVVEAADAGVTAGKEASIVGGAGITILPWPPGPRTLEDRLAFVYNVYTEPAHRRRGLGRLVMQAIHDWCRVQAITAIALNASPDGQPLYESMGYRVMTSPMMLCEIDKAQV